MELVRHAFPDDACSLLVGPGDENACLPLGEGTPLCAATRPRADAAVLGFSVGKSALSSIGPDGGIKGGDGERISGVESGKSGSGGEAAVKAAPACWMASHIRRRRPRHC
eukprot:gene16113-biopygen9732